ncbi:MAG: hypothetical protein WD049_00315 [Candidatus Paceibacterota bacterium]
MKSNEATRLLSVLFLSIAAAWGASVPIHAAEEQEKSADVAPLHDPREVMDVSPYGDVPVAVRKDALLLKAYDGHRMLGPTEHRGRLLQELVRQAMLIAARDELGLITRDQTLGELSLEAEADESTKAELPGGSIQIVSSIPGDFGEMDALSITVFREDTEGPQVLWEQKVPTPQYRWKMVEHFSERLEQLARNDLVTVLREAGYEGTGSEWVKNAPVPEDVQQAAMDWNMTPQFFAIRSLHRLIREEGESAERLAALAESYARLGTLTAHHMSPAHQAFKARALLYSQRLSVIMGRDPIAYETRAYVRALLGRHQPALDDLNRQAEQGFDLSERTKVIEAFCRFDQERLESFAAEPDLRPLVRYLQFLAVEPYKSEAAIEPVATALLEEQPDCFAARDLLSQRGSLGVRRSAAAGGPRVFADSLYERLQKQTDLPPAVDELVNQGAASQPQGLGAEWDPQELQIRRDLIAALRQAGSLDRDPSEFSWAVLDQLIEETGVVQATRMMYFLRYALGVPREQLIGTVRLLSPLLDDHRHGPAVLSYARSSEENTRQIPRYLASLNRSDLEVTMEPIATHLHPLHPPAWQGIIQPALDHLDLVYRDLVYQIERGEGWGGKGATWMLAEISPHAPAQAVGQIRFRWEFAEIRDRADEYETEFGQYPEVLQALGERYREAEDWEAAERVLSQLVELQPSKQAYEALASVYQQQGQHDKWLETMEAFLETPESGLSHARVRANIAEHYLEQGEPEKALPYAEEAAGTWAAWAMTSAIRAHEALGNFAEAEVWVRRRAERYDNLSLTWYAWCRRMGTGDLRAAAAHAQEYLSSMTRPLPDQQQMWVAAHYLFKGLPSKSLPEWQELYDRTKSPYHGLHAALVAREQGDVALSDQLLQQIVEIGTRPPVEEVKHATVKLAELFQDAFKQEEPLSLDQEAVDELIRGAPAGEPTNLSYFVGKLLWIDDQQQAAKPYLLMSARSPVDKLNRELAGALLRDHGTDFGKLAPQELLQEKK